MGKPGELLKQPKVLISDEATSSLDQNTAEHLALPINQFRGGHDCAGHCVRAYLAVERGGNMSTIISYDEAIVELGKLTSSGKYTLQDRMDLGSRVSVAGSGGLREACMPLRGQIWHNPVRTDSIYGSMELY